MHTYSPACEVLVVDDLDLDVQLMQAAAERSDFASAMSHVADGVQALAYLNNEAPYEEVCRPDLVLLDLNMPGLTGHDVLEAIEDDPDLKRIPVIVFTGSRSDRDVERAYRRGANAYVTKPTDLPGFVDAFRRIRDFWLGLAELAPR
jgi:CheY-like chemotaxis protein